MTRQADKKRAAASGEAFRQKLIAVLTRCGTEAANGRITLHVPQTRGPFLRRTERHYHPVAELFIQIAGESAMQFPHERIRIRAGELLLVPQGTPHAETVCPPEDAFCNLVLYFGHQTFTAHEAHAGKQEKPLIVWGLQIPCSNEERLSGYLDAIVEARDAEGASSTCGMTINGLLQAYMGSLVTILEQPTPSRHQSPKVLECRRLVKERLTDPEMNVDSLAQWAGCAPDYLSHRFHVETGTTITNYIQEKRITLAKSMLDRSTMNIAQIAYACGYRDPGYFTRQFRKHMKVSPRKYRQSR